MSLALIELFPHDVTYKNGYMEHRHHSCNAYTYATRIQGVALAQLQANTIGIPFTVRITSDGKTYEEDILPIPGGTKIEKAT